MAIGDVNIRIMSGEFHFVKNSSEYFVGNRNKKKSHRCVSYS